jgi:hypothetical protein
MEWNTKIVVQYFEFEYEIGGCHLQGAVDRAMSVLRAYTDYGPASAASCGMCPQSTTADGNHLSKHVGVKFGTR